jgi:Uma2 family endonuclease
MSSSRKPRPFSVAEYERLIETGILTKDDHVELIHGFIVEKRPKQPRQSASVRRFNRLFQKTLGDQATISINGAVELADSEPEPHVALLAWRADFYGSDRPRAQDTLLVAEMFDESNNEDRDLRLQLYAENRIPEYWIVNLIDESLEVYRSPRTNGTW